MNHILTVKAHNTPAFMERLLQVVRYRGFDLTALEMKPVADMTEVLITLTVESDKSVGLLTSQLNKLYDIKSLELATTDIAALRA